MKKYIKADYEKPNMRDVVELINLLENNGFYGYSESDFNGNRFTLELVKKAYGDSYSVPTECALGYDYNRAVELCERVNVKLPNYAWYD